MIRLPLECLFIILEELKIKDLLNCRLVSKTFKYAISKIKIEELICIKNSKRFVKLLTVSDLNWYSTKRKLSFNNLINLNGNKMCLNQHLNCKLLSCCFDFLSNLFNLKYLKRLKIDYMIIDGRFETDYLAKFPFIEHLEINQFLTNTEFKRIIKLNNLKILCINRDHKYFVSSFHYYSDYKCLIDAPKLEILCHQNDNFYLINLLKLETIKKFQYSSFLNTIFKFNNLEHLIVNRFHDNLSGKSIIFKLPKLKILEIIFKDSTEMNSTETHQSLCELISFRNQSKSDLKIYVIGLLIFDIDQFHNLIDETFNELLYDFEIDDSN